MQLTLPLHFDNGFNAALYKAEPYFGGGLVMHWATGERLVWGFHLHDALRFGGAVKERPCHDGFRRRFHCGTGLPWSDAQPHLRSSEISTLGQLKLHLRF